MSGEDKDKKEFEFIKEQVIQKKRRKFRKWIIAFCMTTIMAVVFGLVAAVTFCVTEPRFYRYLHREDEVKKPITFPTNYPEDGNIEVSDILEGEGGAAINGGKSEGGSNVDPKEGNNPSGGQADPVVKQQPDDNIIFSKIEADIDDYLSMSDDIRTVAYQANKSMLKVSSIVKGTDLFGDSSNTRVTTGLVVGNDEVNLLILVSLDRVVNASAMKVELTEGVSVDAILQDYETELNLAIIAVKLEDIPPLYLNNNIKLAALGESFTITVGSPIIAVGNPNGYPGSIELGIINSRGSYVSITDNKLDLFNTSITDNVNSDGVIVNLRGEVIGIITRTFKKGLNKNLNTVIGISKIKSIIEDMANYQSRIYCGVFTEDMTEEARKVHEVLNGIYVNEVVANSPAFKAGIKGGDIIMHVEDKSILNTNSFYKIISDYEAGDEIKLKIKRTTGSTNKEMEIIVTLLDKEQ
ncbi:MAG TPA: S1C family serine protease [Mobilitalea sp.]|nr:S1C family serine protease [Mobilitalea sp.]